MKLIIKKNILLDNLLNTSKAISTRNLIPILTGIKFDLKKEGLYLSASDSDISIRTFRISSIFCFNIIIFICKRII